MDIIKEVEASLDKASTQHEWDTDGTFIQWKDGHPLKGTYRQIAITQALTPEIFRNENHENDAHLIANAPEWLRHLLSIISKQEIIIHQLRGALGYPVPGDIIDNPEIINGIAEALSQQVSEQKAEIERNKATVREALEALERAADLGSTGEDARWMHVDVDYAISELKKLVEENPHVNP